MIKEFFLPNYEDDMMALQGALAGSMNGSDTSVSGYEEDLANYFHANRCVAVQSCTVALIAALKAVGVRAGDWVVMPPTAPQCTAYAVLALNATPKFVDTEVAGFGISLPATEEAIRSGSVKAVIEVPMFGYPTSIDQLYSLVSDHGIPLVADLAHCHGTTLHSQPLSKHATVSCFSTHERKILSTGEGGFILTDNDEIAAKCRGFRQNGYLHGREPGINGKLPGLHSELGRSRLRHLDEQLAIRRHTFAKLSQILTSDVVRPLSVVPGGFPNGYAAVLEIAPAKAEAFLAYQVENGIPSDVARYGIRCLFEHPTLMRFHEDCPNATSLLRRITTFPTHPGIGDDELRHMSRVINEFNNFNR